MAPAELSIHSSQPSPRVKRSQSISSDRPSLQGYGGLLSPPAAVSPYPAFIAASAASQIVTNDHDSQADTWFDQHGIEPSGETALVSQQSLKLVNRFLDQLLFNFLSVSRSTTLAALRPAVSEVLKPKLASGAISGADQELNEYLGGGEDEDLLAMDNEVEASGDWDLELVWKRTRLRCMVYSSLGDMEEEDEDYYTEQEHLDGPPGTSKQYSSNPGVVSPAVAIFLTSILEFMGEQVLIVAGQAAYHRIRAKHEKDEKDGAATPLDIAERVIVEDHDMERVALDRTLGRLWRGWKKRIRSPNTSISISRSFSRESLLSQPSKAPSLAAEGPIDEDEQPKSLAAILFEQAANIALPMTDNDVNEIEVPGLGYQSDVEEEEPIDEGYHIPQRPKSFTIFNYESLKSVSPIELQVTKKRSNSLPVPPPSRYISPKPSQEAANEELGTATPQVPEDTQEVAPLRSEQVVEEITQTAEPIRAINEKEGDEAASKDTYQEPKSRVNGVLVGVAGIAAVGVATAAVAISAVHKDVTKITPAEDLKIEDNEEDEEPQILTSSRVSLGGRNSPDEHAGVSRKSSIRSASVHSLRLIDVAAPKSPQRSRHGSVDGSEQTAGGRPGASRSSSVHSNALNDAQSPRVGSPVVIGIPSSSVVRNGSSLSMSRTRNSAGESIAEVEEKASSRTEVMNGSQFEPATNTAVAADYAGAMQGVDVETRRAPLTDREIMSQSLHSHTQQYNFALGAAPPSKSSRLSLDLSNSLPIQSNQTSGTTKAIGMENGVPPLTPLREMMEGAPDTSDESSSPSHSNDAQSVVGNGASSQPPSTYAPVISQSQRAADQQRAAWTAPVTNRSSPPRMVRPDTARTITADSPPRARGPLHTSGSQSSGTSLKLKPTRTSEDDRRSTESKSQSFEQLIRSDQTIQYTLTPQSMRDIEAPDSPRNALHPSISASQQEFRPSTSRSHSSSISKITGLNSNPPASGAASIRSAKTFRPIPRPNVVTPTGSRQRANAPQARDARIEQDSMGDFAEFIRSTGPVAPYEAPPSISSRPSRAGSHSGANGSARNVSGTVPRVSSSASLPRRAESAAGRNRLQARDAVVSRGDSISDLIDFVRSGPQLDKETHRIPRTVAPFRSTMDSDQMSGAVGGKAIDASLPFEVRHSQATSNSVNSSVTSQAPLLKNKALPPQKTNEFDEEDMMPKRKTRRVRDPYAIDFSDEEEEYEVLTGSRPQPIQEESLADFLRNVPPPPEPVTTSVFADVPHPANKGLKKKASSPSIMARFGRNNSSGPQPPPKHRPGEVRPPVAKAPTHTPIAAHYSATNVSNTQNNNLNSFRPEPTPAPRTKVAQKSYQPREAVHTQGARTNDLADFLMRSEPPTIMATQPQTFLPAVHKEETSAFQRMFGRKKGVH